MHISAEPISHVFYRDLGQQPPTIVSGEGCYVVDDGGRRYLDAVAGVSVAALGHGVVEIGEVVAREAQSLPYVYNAGFSHRWQERLASEIAGVMPSELSSVFFTSGGSEANETALKLARQYHVEAGTPTKYKCIARELSYHGATLATLSLSGRPSWKAPFEPLLTEVPRAAVPYRYRCTRCDRADACNLACADDLEDVILREGPETVAAFIAEPVLGSTATGVVPAPEYYRRIREICDRYDVLFIADEVLVGYGRTGRWAAIDHWGVVPDLITLGKSLGAGYAALAAVVASERVVGTIASGSQRFTHGFTYGGMPISCLIGSEVHRQLRERGLVEHVATTGRRLQEGLAELQRRHECIGEVRGLGLIAGIEFVRDPDLRTPYPEEERFAERVVAGAFERGVMLIQGIPGIAGPAGGDHVQLSPPYTISPEQIDTVLDVLDEAIGLTAARAR